MLPGAKPLNDVNRVDYRLQTDEIIRSTSSLDDAYLDEEFHVLLVWDVVLTASR